MWPEEMIDRGIYTDMVACCPETNIVLGTEYLHHDTPARPDFWFGSYLVSRCPVDEGYLNQVRAEWQQRFSHRTGLVKQIVQWEESVEGDYQCLEPRKIGKMAADPDLVLVFNKESQSIGAPNLSNHSLAQRAVLEFARNNSDFEEVFGLALNHVRSTPDSPATEEFLRWRYVQHQARMCQGQGFWGMMKVDGKLLATCGIVISGSTARFRDVTTHPEWRGRGLGREMCRRVVDHVFALPQIKQVVIVATPNSQAERIYRYLGFRPASIQYSLVWDY